MLIVATGVFIDSEDNPDFYLYFFIISEYFVGFSILITVKTLEYCRVYPLPCPSYTDCSGICHAP